MESPVVKQVVYLTNRHRCGLRSHSVRPDPVTSPPRCPTDASLGLARESRKLLECIWEISDVIAKQCWVGSYGGWGRGGGRGSCSPSWQSLPFCSLSRFSSAPPRGKYVLNVAFLQAPWGVSSCVCPPSFPRYSGVAATNPLHCVRHEGEGTQTL